MSLLHQWKQDAENRVLEEIEGRIQVARRLPEPEEKEGWICPFCKTIADYDQLVCLGCHAEIVPGPTSQERENAMKTGLMLGGFLSLLLFVGVPTWLNSTFGWHIQLAFGLGPYAFGVAAAFIITTAVGCVWFEISRRASQAPRFFRNTLG